MEKNALLNLINDEPDTNRICLYAKHPWEAKYQLPINKRKTTAWNYSKAFIE